MQIRSRSNSLPAFPCVAGSLWRSNVSTQRDPRPPYKASPSDGPFEKFLPALCHWRQAGNLIRTALYPSPFHTTRPQVSSIDQSRSPSLFPILHLRQTFPPPESSAPVSLSSFSY